MLIGCFVGLYFQQPQFFNVYGKSKPLFRGLYIINMNNKSKDPCYFCHRLITLAIYPNSNRGTENNNQNNFDTNGNLSNLNNIGNLEWYYNNTLNKLTKADKPNTTQYYVS
jgi:hypothetical protein